MTVKPRGSLELGCTVVRDPAKLIAEEPVWRELQSRSAMNEPMLSPLWNLAWWRVFGASGARRLRVGLFRDGTRLVGVAPLLARPYLYAPGIPFRRLELLASGEPEEDEICSEYLGIVAERGREEAVARTLAAALQEGRFGSWDEIVFPAMDAEGSMPGLVVEALRRKGVETESVPSGACSYIPLPSSWDEYLASLSSSGRYVLKRSLREFSEWAGGSFELHEARSPADLREGTRILKALHAERWLGGGVFKSRRFSAFHETVTRELLAQNALELLWLEARGRPLAAVYNIRWNGKEYFYQSGRTLDVPKRVRPGFVIHALAIQRAIAAGRREYDFLGGSSQYKSQLGTVRRALVLVRGVRAPLREAVRRATERGGRQALRLGRRTLGSLKRTEEIRGKSL
jgi:CelD/BcsL family acetyltransferase involved in cellulose biosynthesis